MVADLDKELHFNVTEKHKDFLRELLHLTECQDYDDLFNNAISLLFWTVEEIKKGNKFCFVPNDHEGYEELGMRVFRTVRRNFESEAKNRKRREELVKEKQDG